MIVRRFRQLLQQLDPLAQHPRIGTATGLVLVALLVPILAAWNGGTGPLGQSLPLLFLVPVLVAAAVGGRVAGVLVSFAAIAAWDWFFIPPLYQVTIASGRDVVALVVFLLVALSVGQLSNIARRRSVEALRRMRSSEALYGLSVALIAQKNPAETLTPLTQQLSRTFDLIAAAVLMPDQDGKWRTVAVAGILPPDLLMERSRNVAAAVSETYNQGHEYRIGGANSAKHGLNWSRRPRSGFERARFIPLRISERTVGVLELVPQVGEETDVEREHLVQTFANGAAIALEQARLAREEKAAALAQASDNLKSALLSSVSHDLRTPLAGIKAAASSLLQDDIEWSAEDRNAFIMDINTEADRLSRLVSNLLDLSRIEAGAIRPDKDWEDVGELLERVLSRMRPRLEGHPIEQAIAGDLPMVQLDALQIEQVMTNLLENAAKYSPAGSPIIVSATATQAADGTPEIRIAVRDFGPGIPKAEQEKIFDKFYRVKSATARVSGTGMGLAIVKGLVDAQGGRVTVESSPGNGSTFIVELPVGSPAGKQAAGTSSGPSSTAGSGS
ncbi:MAG: histidine kinase [Chloroflexi bacterium]|nr:histidine kinase [Chloroflexota bacterium]